MLNRTTGKSTKKTSHLQTGVLCLLVSFVLLSSCVLRKSIAAFLSGSVTVELIQGGGAKKIKTTADEAMVAKDAKLCSSAEESVLDSLDSRTFTSSLSFLPPAFFLINLLGIAALALSALFPKISLAYYTKALNAFAGTPIYIKNRLLLI